MKKQRFLKEVLSTSIYLLCVLIFTIIIVKYVCQRTQVVGISMQDTLMDKDNILVEKITYRFEDPGRFDVVVFPHKYLKRTNLIKRIIGLPGETVYIDQAGNIYINDVLLEEHYGNEVIEDAGCAAVPITLKEDEYFLMGDNRNDSIDSREAEVGIIRRQDIIGRAWFKFWPINDMHVVQ